MVSTLLFNPCYTGVYVQGIFLVTTSPSHTNFNRAYIFLYKSASHVNNNTADLFYILKNK